MRPNRRVLALLPLLLAFPFAPSAARAADVYLRVRVAEPAAAAADKFLVVVDGFRHAGEPWQFPDRTVEVPAGGWGAWVNLSDWPWHGKVDRQGGVAEWPSVKLTVRRAGAGADKPVAGCAVEVQLADRPDAAGVVHTFVERSESDAVGFLVPTPLREHAKEFETGSQMVARHHAWAREATGGDPIALKRFQFLTALWGPYDPGLARQSVQTLKLLGFNVVGNTSPDLLRAAGVRSYQTTWLYEPDPREVEKKWRAFAAASLNPAAQTDAERWAVGTGAAHWVVADEITTLDLRGLPPDDLNNWFRQYLRDRGVTDADLGKPVGEVQYPAAAMHAKTLPRDADLPTRRLLYHAARFGQWWSVRQLRRTSDLIKGSLPGAKTETLPSDHGFFGAWGPPHLGMSHRMLDLFEIGSQRAVDQLSAEDWLGLNHMYGPETTWTGAQSFAYFTALCRSARGEAAADIHLRGLITPSDDGYLRLKAYSALGQGARSFFFWTFGPTYIGTENYWSDLRSMYDGLAKLGRAVRQAEDVLLAAEPVRDPVAVLYSVSHDLWHNDDPAAFVEKRLTWHALRHLHVQPDFVREEDVAAGRLKGYRALFVNDWCVGRKAAAAIDAWVRAGGVVYLSGGAATRDEFFEPHVPPFAAAAWGEGDAAARHQKQAGHAYNERGDLPRVQPMTTATVTLGGAAAAGDANAFDLPVIGSRLGLRPDAPAPFARFADGAPAAASVPHGRGRVIAVGFMPMLAYGRLAGFKPTTLEERWPEQPRRIIRHALDAAGVVPTARADVPVVEASLLTGNKGSAVVLVNYTYQPIDALTVDLKLPGHVSRAVSTEGVEVKVERTPDGARLRLPLKWTDIVLLYE